MPSEGCEFSSVFFVPKSGHFNCWHSTPTVVFFSNVVTFGCKVFTLPPPLPWPWVVGCCMNKECCKSRKNWCWRCGNHVSMWSHIYIYNGTSLGCLKVTKIKNKGEQDLFEGHCFVLEDDIYWFSNNEAVERRQSFFGWEKKSLVHWYMLTPRQGQSVSCFWQDLSFSKNNLFPSKSTSSFFHSFWRYQYFS